MCSPPYTRTHCKVALFVILHTPLLLMFIYIHKNMLPPAGNRTRIPRSSSYSPLRPQSPIQWELGFFPKGIIQSVKLAYAHQVPRMRIRGTIPPLPHTSSRRNAYLCTGATLRVLLLLLLLLLCKRASRFSEKQRVWNGVHSAS
jgi:hypothetical protein